MTNRYILSRKRQAPRFDRFVWTDEEAAELFELSAQKFDPSQPRYPKGHPMGGKWRKGPAGGVMSLFDADGEERTIPANSSLAAHLVEQEDGSYRLTPSRQRLHNEIVNKALEGVPPSTNPEFHMMGGGPASGKSTMLEADQINGLPEDGKYVEINSDHIKESIPEYAEWARKNPREAAAYVHEESSLIASRLRAAARATRRNVVYDTTGDSSYSKLSKMVGNYRDAGYDIRAYYASLDTELAVKLADIRGAKTGRYVPEPVVRATHANVSRTLIRAARNNLFDSVVLYDTNVHRKPRLVARGNRNAFEVVNPRLFRKFVLKGQSGKATVGYDADDETFAGMVATTRSDGDHLTTHEIEALTVEVVLGVSATESAVSGPKAAEFRADLAEWLEDLPEGAEVIIGKEYPDADYSNLYDDPVADVNPGSQAQKHDGEGVSNQQYVQIKRRDDEKQIVYGEVYAPNVLDTYGEFMTAEDIEVMAHRFMQLDLRTAIDTQHDNIPNGAYPVESFVARDGDGDYTPGAWVLGVKIPDNHLWLKVKSGELNGFSFQSLVKPTSVDVEYDVIRDHVGKTEPHDHHEHLYLVELDEIGNVIGGRTSKAADGHFHDITRASHTEESEGHSHRFFL